MFTLRKIFVCFAKNSVNTGADPGFFVGGGALVSCSTSTPINYIVFFCRIPVVLENRRSSQGGGVRTPGTHPLDPPLQQEPVSSANDVFHLPKLLMSCHQTSKMPSRIFGGLQSFVRRQNPLFLASYPSSGHLISRT